MNFFKISGLVIGTGSVVGGAGTGIYYAVKSKNNETKNIKKNDENSDGIENNGKVDFIGKLVFLKSGNDTNTIYEPKLLNTEEYSTTTTTFDTTAADGSKYVNVNKIVDISYSLNVETTKNELNSIFGSLSNLEAIKSKILSNKAKLEELFGNTIYENLKTSLGA